MTSARRAFQWTYSGVLIPLFFSMAAAMALADYYWLAYLFAGLFGAWMVGYWVTSHFLLEKKRQAARRSKRRKKLPEQAIVTEAGRARKSYQSWKWGGVIFYAGIAVLTGILIRGRQVSHELQQLHGVLLPANDPDPAGTCGKQYAPDLR